jgi:hypothetical protein
VICDGSDLDLKHSRASTYFDGSFRIGATGQVIELRSVKDDPHRQFSVLD